MVKHTVCHFEWASTDLEKTTTFLSGLFGWEFKRWGNDYLIFNPPEGPGGGIMRAEKVIPGRSPFIYIEVDEIEPYLEKARELGGGIDTPKKDIPGVGWYAHITDHDGNIIGIFKELKK
jgi:predicted enzyme related to lactoylglutathione lyase